MEEKRKEEKGDDRKKQKVNLRKREKWKAEKSLMGEWKIEKKDRGEQGKWKMGIRQGNKELGRQTERDRLREGEREKGCRDKMLENDKEVDNKAGSERKKVRYRERERGGRGTETERDIWNKEAREREDRKIKKWGNRKTGGK
ncbi:U1 small nuclear ribonucleoprotein 70 kDa-like [Zophobas morio]|uniref:U1 small nuclear ribonucleoprotein 70 kDa-like n=1 Tax=Zophobas morio TaxID=2755281 RepID=UPI0030837203